MKSSVVGRQEWSNRCGVGLWWFGFYILSESRNQFTRYNVIPPPKKWYRHQKIVFSKAVTPGTKTGQKRAKNAAGCASFFFGFELFQTAEFDLPPDTNSDLKIPGKLYSTPGSRCQVCCLCQGWSPRTSLTIDRGIRFLQVKNLLQGSGSLYALFIDSYLCGIRWAFVCCKAGPGSLVWACERAAVRAAP